MLEAARTRACEALSALAAAEASSIDTARRGDPWSTVRAQERLLAAGRAYAAADGWLVSLLIGAPARRLARQPWSPEET